MSVDKIKYKRTPTLKEEGDDKKEVWLQSNIML